MSQLILSIPVAIMRNKFWSLSASILALNMMPNPAAIR